MQELDNGSSRFVHCDDCSSVLFEAFATSDICRAYGQAEFDIVDEIRVLPY